MVDLVQSIPLRCSCPTDCECKKSDLKTWCHSYCKKPSRINCVGDIYCPDHKAAKECFPYFIKDASFKCTES